MLGSKRNAKRGGAEAHVKKRWGFFWAKKDQDFDENADPKVQMHQVIQAAEEEHRDLTDTAASVIGNQKSAEMELHRMMDQEEALAKRVRSALVLEAKYKTSEPAKAIRYAQQAGDVNRELKRLRESIETQKALVEQATDAAQRAKKAVETNSRTLQDRVSERKALLAANDQAVMQERFNQSMVTLNGQIGDGVVPTFDEVRKKIESRAGKAMGAAELHANSSAAIMAELDDETLALEADEELDAMRAELGLIDQPAELSVGDATTDDASPASDELAPRRTQTGS